MWFDPNSIARFLFLWTIHSKDGDEGKYVRKLFLKNVPDVALLSRGQSSGALGH